MVGVEMISGCFPVKSHLWDGTTSVCISLGRNYGVPALDLCSSSLQNKFELCCSCLASLSGLVGGKFRIICTSLLC